ncbi:hypothetical protein ACHQM5_024276 [Ranunculus cassubicifolius]
MEYINPTHIVDLDMEEGEFEDDIDEAEAEIDQLPQGSTQSTAQGSTQSTAQGTHLIPPQKRIRKLKSDVWQMFKILPRKPEEVEKAVCKKCGFIAKSGSNQGTGNMKRHIKRCKATTYRDVGQMIISHSDSNLDIKPSKFDPLVFRELIDLAIIRHDLPFQFVEYEGIREAFRYAAYANQELNLVSRNTVKSDIIKIHGREKGKLKKMMLTCPGRICLTSDLWTSIANDGYISLTAHYVDDDWKLQKRVISFSYMPTPHTGNAICEKIHSLLADWGIEKKLFSITLDNATSNLTFVNLLRSQLNLQEALLCDGDYFHIRCCCHIINLVVHEGLTAIDNSVLKIRESIKYCRGSQGRKKAFYDSVRHVSLPCSKGLRQDVATRWDSTFYMLESAVFYKRAFMHLSLTDSNYKDCPTREEWVKVEKICEYLGLFANVTKLFSGTLYPTSNLFFREMFLIQDAIKKAIASDDEFMNMMGEKMKEKFGDYWTKHNIILAMAVVMDPRYKMNFVEYAFNAIYGNNSETKKVRTNLDNLLDLYVKTYSAATTSATQQQDGAQTQLHNTRHGNDLLKDFESFESEEYLTAPQKSQLELYLLEPKRKITEPLDVLDYWKSNQFRYPELARMARDILSIPISTVASESAFSVGGRVIDQFRSALLPENVESLVCSNDWLFKKKGNILIDICFLIILHF